MANKTQIKKFLETKKQEATKKLWDERDTLKKQAQNNFFEAYKDKFEEIKTKVTTTGAEYDNLIYMCDELGLIASPRKRHYSPECLFNQLSSSLSITELEKCYIDVVEAEKISAKYNKKVEETDREYKNLIALCDCNTAKDGIKILENLGFNISEIEVKKESTTLITNIDARKLFV